ncbi:MAG: GNAT family N-acetyltransferase [Defluviitaleaceae bacterium]|nr:GNAT family N-acetyltransferase [Defluviitaleaceae bacterium]
MAEIHTFGRRMAFRGILADQHLFNEINVLERVDYFKKEMKDDTRQTFVYEKDNVVLGFATIQPCDETCLEILRIYVDPAMQNSGIGTKMLDFCRKTAIKNTHSQICLWVVEQNNAARKFYEAKGFATNGTTRNYKNSAQIKYHQRLM